MPASNYISARALNSLNHTALKNLKKPSGRHDLFIVVKKSMDKPAIRASRRKVEEQYSFVKIRFKRMRITAKKDYCKYCKTYWLGEKKLDRHIASKHAEEVIDI